MSSPTKESAKARVAELVRSFERHESDYLGVNYLEAQARTDFITPLLVALGWDVYNQAGYSLGLREVVEESAVDVENERASKKPDYELRLARQRKIFIEAKKPSVKIDRNHEAAFQTRRYGYSAGLPISVLTNFYTLTIYDCTVRPSQSDDANVARILTISYKEFESRFDEIWSALSREAVYSGEFDRRFATDVKRQGVEHFDAYFLSQVKSWRERLAVDIMRNVPGLSASELTFAVQLFLSRIIFLRICEDRDIERYEMLKGLGAQNSFNLFMNEMRRADAFYDSGLFCLMDDERLGIKISDSVLAGIIDELYYPQSPYTFAVVEAEVLGEIYEQFLGDVITISDGKVSMVTKAEVRESGGVFPTPRYIVDRIVERTLAPLLAGKSPDALSDFTVADICCGSGIFLLSAFEFLLNYYLDWYLKDIPRHAGVKIYEQQGGKWGLVFEEKRRILVAHLRGVDIDSTAVEVARFSLLLKLIDSETGAALRAYVNEKHEPALPDLSSALKSGNSLVSPAEWRTAIRTITPELAEKIKPFEWSTEFPAEMRAGGFTAIVGNPPYIRTQKMVVYSPEEVAFFQNGRSPYATAHQDNFDKYALFVERALSLAGRNGRVGWIVPHKFMTTQAGRALRSILTHERLLSDIIHFGVLQVFGAGVSNYTCILILDCRRCEQVSVEKVSNLENWRYGKPGKVSMVSGGELGDAPWQLADDESRAVFERAGRLFPETLSSVSEIFVGLQTSADSIFIFKSSAESRDTVDLTWNGRTWPIERGILKPCMNDVSLTPYARAAANMWMIFPYEIVVVNNRTKARLIPEASMSQRFPGCWNYLKAREAELLKRNFGIDGDAPECFYQFGRSQSLTKFNSPKIVLPILSKEARYAYDEANITVTGGGNGPYYMIRAKPNVGNISTLFLLGMLHHPLCEALVRSRTSVFRGGFYSHGKQFIENLPVPVADAETIASVELLVRQLIDVTESAAAARTPHQRDLLQRTIAILRAQVEDVFTNLYRLDSHDLQILTAFEPQGGE